LKFEAPNPSYSIPILVPNCNLIETPHAAEIFVHRTAMFSQVQLGRRVEHTVARQPVEEIEAARECRYADKGHSWELRKSV
jgi:hypothetical protein